MSRPKKSTVDYFPHNCTHQKTMFVLEEKFGNDGYAFWFKLLEMLGSTEGHWLDLNDGSRWEFLTAKTRLTDSICEEILTLLAKMGAIDKELWNERKIWSQNFTDGISDAYRNRIEDTPTKPPILRNKPRNNEESDVIKPHSKVKDIKLKKSIKERESDFVKAVTKACETSPKYLPEKERFILHWAQADGAKLHFEKQQTFDIPKRLQTWLLNDYGTKQESTDPPPAKYGKPENA